MEKITVVKIGGNVIDDPAALRGFLADFASLPGAKILVHGGGKLATRLAQKLELQVQMVDGRRITDKGTLDIVTMVYAGLVNKQLVAGLQAAGCNALGLSGADGNAVMARRRAPEPIDYGSVGAIRAAPSATDEATLSALQLSSVPCPSCMMAQNTGVTPAPRSSPSSVWLTLSMSPTKP